MKYLSLWVAFFLGLILTMFFMDVSRSLGAEAAGDVRCAECTGMVFVPYIDDTLVFEEFDDKASCQAFLDEIEPQTRPFARLECSAEMVARTEM